MIRLPILIIVLVFLAAQATSQGYAGTVTTGKGIIPPLKVGSGEIAADSLGSGDLSNLSGIWSFDLSGPSTKHMGLAVQQSREVLIGYGNMTADGNYSSVKVSGNISGGNIDLFVPVIDSSEMYRLRVFQSGTSLTGKYDEYSAGVITLTGTVTGSIKPTDASGGRAIIKLGNDLSQAVPMDVRSSATTQESIQDASSNGTDHRIEKRSFTSTSSGGQVTTSDVSVMTNYS